MTRKNARYVAARKLSRQFGCTLTEALALVAERGFADAAALLGKQNQEADKEIRRAFAGVTP